MLAGKVNVYKPKRVQTRAVTKKSSQTISIERGLSGNFKRNRIFDTLVMLSTLFKHTGD